MLGTGAAGDAVHMTAPDREGGGVVRAIGAALADAGLVPAAVDFVSAHGTGTPFNDAMEARALVQLFGEHAVPVNSIKGAIGHTLGAAGAFEAVLCAEVLARGRRATDRGTRAGGSGVRGTRSRTRRRAPVRRACRAVHVVRLRRCECGAGAGSGMSEVAITGGATVLDGDLESRLDALPEVVRMRGLRAERVTQLVLAAAGDALAAAGLLVTDGDPRPEAGVALGTAFGCFLTNASYQRRVGG